MTSRGNTLQPAADRTAIGLSLLCAAHCLILPLLVMVSPTIAALGIEDESFHIGMLFIVIPVSAYALYVGMKNHNGVGTVATGIVGLLILCLGAALGHDALGETGERVVTLSGVSLVALCHLSNYRACKHAAAKGRTDTAQEACPAD